MRDILSYILHIVFPVRCPVCGRLAVPFCSECVSGAAGSPLPPFCSECGGPYGVDCCDESLPCYAAAMHDGAARRLLLALKYSNIRPLGEALGKEMAKRFPDVSADLIIPVPLHSDSKRAYNQTVLISRGISAVNGIPVAEDMLKWSRPCGKQTGRSGAARKALSFDSMEASKEIADRKVILVDDVYTTGGTLRAALSALRRAGADVLAALLWTRRLSGENPAAWPEYVEEDDFWYN